MQRYLACFFFVFFLLVDASQGQVPENKIRVDVVFRNKDTVRSLSVEGSCELQTKYGKLTIPIKEIESLIVGEGDDPSVIVTSQMKLVGKVLTPSLRISTDWLGEKSISIRSISSLRKSQTPRFDSLEGTTWILTKIVTRHGECQDENGIAVYSFSKDKVFSISKNNKTESETYSLGGNEHTKTIDFTMYGEMYSGVYLVNGETLRISYRLSGSIRPVNVDAALGENEIALVLKLKDRDRRK